MRYSRDFLNFVLIFIISLILVLDLFVHNGQNATFDGPTHITMIAQFHRAFSDGNFPVQWADGYANYGLPIPIFTQQLTNYIGGALSFIFSDYVLVSSILFFIAAFLSTLFFYRFLRLYFSEEHSLLGAVIFNFAPYRIIDIYIRGALPEFFSSIFLPIALYAIYKMVKEKKLSGAALLLFALVMTLLTHPMAFVLFQVVLIPYLFFLLFQNYEPAGLKRTVLFFASPLALYIFLIIVSVGIGAYYVVPLQLEIKYLNYGHETNNLAANQFLSWKNFLDPSWYYYYKNDVFTRGHFIKTGVIEFLSLIAGWVALLYKWSKKQGRTWTILEYAVITGTAIIFFLTPLSNPLFQHIKLLNAIQLPWRFVLVFNFIAPILLLYFFQKVKNQWIIFALICFFTVLYTPQIYGKNYTLHSSQYYRFTTYNLHSASLNTLWTGKTEEYPVKSKKYDIIDGKGTVEKATVKNSQREYTVDAQTPIRLVDYTFYFPGWKVFVDGKETEIQFQDANYRGVITYIVPAGRHEIKVVFQPTRLRKIGMVVTVLTTIISVIMFIIVNKFQKKRTKKT